MENFIMITKTCKIATQKISGMHTHKPEIPANPKLAKIWLIILACGTKSWSKCTWACIRQVTNTRWWVQVSPTTATFKIWPFTAWPSSKYKFCCCDWSYQSMHSQLQQSSSNGPPNDLPAPQLNPWDNVALTNLTPMTAKSLHCYYSPCYALLLLSLLCAAATLPAVGTQPPCCYFPTVVTRPSYYFPVALTRPSHCSFPCGCNSAPLLLLLLLL